MKANEKAPGIDALLTSITGKDRVVTVSSMGCVTCDSTDVVFRNELSEKEYRISGMCQECQDSVFGVE